jgi:hypothetical protein
MTEVLKPSARRLGSAADHLLAGSVLATFLAEHPHVRLDLVVSDASTDISRADSISEPDGRPRTRRAGPEGQPR